MTVDDSRREIWEAMQRSRPRAVGPEPELPLHGGDGGGTSGGMEARIARLEASMDYVKAELGRLSGLPTETARIAERIDHLATKAELKVDFGALADRFSGLSAEFNRTSERLNHFPTRAEMKSEIEAVVDRAGARTQRTVAIVGGLVTIAVAFITYAPKLAALL